MFAGSVINNDVVFGLENQNLNQNTEEYNSVYKVVTIGNGYVITMNENGNMLSLKLDATDLKFIDEIKNNDIIKVKMLIEKVE